METKGLTTTEAKQLQREYGYNKITEQHSFHILTALVKQIFSLLNILLIVAAGVSFAIQHYTDAILILTIVFLNSAISFWQEYKAEETLAELKNLTPTLTRVMRDGREVQIDTEQVVPGDLIILEMGDKIPADGRVVFAHNFEVNESALTGESSPVFKQAMEEDHDQVYSGTLSVNGRAFVQVNYIGDNTKFGKIAHTLTQIKETETPLQKQIKKLALNLGGLAIVLSSAIYFGGIYLGYDRLDMFLTAVSSAVALVPEGLPSILLITMAVGVRRMAQKRAVVRKLVAIEGLGSINIICTDKTGTLTQGKMLVQKIWLNGQTHSPADFKQLWQKDGGKLMLDTMIMANTASLSYSFDRKSVQVLGDTTEGALLMFAHEIGVDYELYREQGKLLDEFSFDQERKSMSVVWQTDDKQPQILGLIKSSPEFMVQHSNRIYENGRIRNLSQEDKQELIAIYQKFAKQGYRMLGFGYKDDIPTTDKYDREEVEQNVIFLGFTAMIDPLRPEVKRAIATASKAGIKSVMITGDNELTAMTIAKDLGLVDDHDQVTIGKDLQRLTDSELEDLLTRVKVFARTNPEDKLRLVQTYQRMGLNVAVTGDGVNDALALKQAEIGVAMGKSGTDVAKEASDIVITDDNYATIITAIEEGRTIYDNILKAVRYLLSTNFGEILVIMLALIIGLPAPLLPAQILWINLVSDGLPALALAVDPKDPLTMQKHPRKRQDQLLSWRVVGYLTAIGLTVALITLAAFWTVLRDSGDLTLARTYAFSGIIVLQMVVAFIIHGRGKFNYSLLGAVFVTLLIQFIILSTPALHGVFEITRPW